MFLNSRVRLSILIVFFVVMTACTGDAVDDRLYLSPSAYGPVRVGMSIEEASEQLGMALVPGYELTEDDHFCYFVYAADQKNQLKLMVEEGLISRFDVIGDGISTIEGIHIGSSGSDVVAAYSDRLKIEPHKYAGPAAKNYIVDGKSGYAIIFEVINNRVIKFRSGKYPSVGYVEGCL